MSEYKWGIYFKGVLMNSYPDTREGFLEAVQDATRAFYQTNFPHEVKHYKLEDPERKEQWAYSYNEEHYHGVFDTKEEAIKEARSEQEEEAKIWVGKVRWHTVQVDTEQMIDNIKDVAYEEMGEASHHYLNNLKMEHHHILQERVSDVVLGWMKEFGYEPDFYQIDHSEEV